MKTTQPISAISAALLAVALSACGASPPAPAQSTPVPAADPAPDPAADPAPAVVADEAKPHHEQGEHNFPAAVAAFHELMAPKWHAEPSDQRQADTCGALAAFNEAADKIGSDPVPAEAAAREGSWHNAVADLNIAIGSLRSACAADGRPHFQDSFQDMHDAFHRLVALVGHEDNQEGAEHEGHDDH